MIKKLTKSFLIYGIGTGISQSILILLVPFYTRYFSESQYGALEVIQSLLLLLLIFGMLQIESAVGRYYYLDEFKKEKKQYISTAILTIVFLSTLLTLLGIFFSENLSLLLFNTKKYATIIKLAILNLPFANLFAFFSVVIRYEEKPILYGIILVIQVITTIALTILLVVYYSLGIEAVFYGQLLGFIIGSGLYIYFFKEWIGVVFNKNIVKKYLTFSLPMIPGVIANWGSNHLNRFIMLSFLSLNQIGVYVAAYKIASVFKLLEVAFKMSWHPFMLEQFINNPNHKEVFKNVLKYVVIFLLVLVVIMFLMSDLIVKIVLPENYYQAKELLGIISLAFAIIIIATVINIGPILKKKTIFNTYSSLFALFVNILLMYFLIPRYGVMGVAISLLAGNFSLLIVSTIFSEKLYKVYFKK